MRCALSLFLFPALVPLSLAQDNDAEKLFRDMEKKIKAAKAFEVHFAYQLDKTTTQGSLLLTKDNKTRLRLNGRFHFGAKRNASFELVSDGKRLKTKGAKLVIASNGQAGYADGRTEKETPRSLYGALTATLSRGGMGFTVMILPYLIGSDTDPDGEESKMHAYDFKAGAAEKVGEREARVIRYRFGKGDTCPDDAEVTLWIDAETNLPLKRVLETPRGERIRITETYNEFKLDPKVDAKAFELPK